MVLDTVHKQKSFVLTSIIMTLIILLLLIFRMSLTSIPPEQEGGIAITFGTNKVGRGEISPAQPSQAVSPPDPSPTPPQPTETTPQPAENVLTQDTDEETVAIPKKETKKPKKEPQPEKKKKEQKPEASTTNALANVLNASNKTSAQGKGNGNQGDDNLDGYKGDPKGDPYSNSFYGGDGSGGNGKGWGLNGRRYISGEKIFQDCNESGFVVVQIEVDRSGKVIRAKAGEKGTTNKAPCLLEAARKSALTYRFNPDDKAPQTQIGFISMHFKLGENK